MKQIFNKIWDLALPYQDQRDDDGHARVTLKYAGRLVELEKGDEDIVIPAIILHDIGYSQIPRERRMLIFSKDATPEERKAVQLEHQKESVRLGEEIMKKLDYPAELIPEILEIISQHDTRKGFISKNEGLTRDADKLWRFSSRGFSADVTRNKVQLVNRCKRLQDDLDIPDYIYSQSARRIAGEELEKLKKQKGDMNIEYTVVEKESLDLIAHLWQKLREHHAGISPRFSTQLLSVSFDVRKEELLEKSIKGYLHIDLVKDKETIIGYCVSSVSEKKAGEIDSIFIESEYRHAGIGGDLMKRALKWMDGLSVTRKTLSVIVGNEEAHRFYSRSGFYPRSTILEQIKAVPDRTVK
jgi:ribosomal protein S18 acetylase RimI-like enzyme